MDQDRLAKLAQETNAFERELGIALIIGVFAVVWLVLWLLLDAGRSAYWGVLAGALTGFLGVHFYVERLIAQMEGGDGDRDARS